MKKKSRYSINYSSCIWLGLLVFGWLLAGCESNSTAGSGPVTSTVANTANGGAVTGTAGGGSVGLVVSTAIAVPTNAAATAAATRQTSPAGQAPTVAPVTPRPGSAQARERVIQAWQKLTANQTFRYKLVQTGELKSGGSLTSFEAQGDGEWQLPAFHQLLSFREAGQTQNLEAYGTDKQLYQRVVSLVIWRRVTPVVAGPFPTLNRVENGGNYQDKGPESLNGQSANKYGWEMAATGFFPAAGGPESLGALTASNLYLAFDPARSGPVQATIWVNPANGQLLRYRLEAQLTNGEASLGYTATFDYFDAGSPINVSPPPDLPR